MAASPASATGTVDCGYSDANVSSITTDYFDNGTFEVHVMPTAWARADGSDGVTYAMWHAVQSCVSGLYGDLADSIYQQLQCHVWYGADWFATGPTYDLESWHLPLVNPGASTYIGSHCLNLDTEDRVVPADAETA